VPDIPFALLDNRFLGADIRRPEREIKFAVSVITVEVPGSADFRFIVKQAFTPPRVNSCTCCCNTGASFACCRGLPIRHLPGVARGRMKLTSERFWHHRFCSEWLFQLPPELK
jgi:hypothetical protein